jgi:UDPglucose--hexose-1-phosphate uridylyltransferase
VAISPERRGRPGADRPELEPLDPAELDACPFCEGHEDRTPPEVLAVSAGEREPDTPGWQVRVVPNLYPAFERQEVVISSPRHVRSLAELDDAEVACIAAAWLARSETAEREGFAYVHAFLNEGKAAGASLPHSHTQLVWLRDPPELVTSERTTRGTCGACALVHQEQYAVAERDDVVALVHPAGRFPYELLIAPRAHEASGFASAALPSALALLAESIRRLHELEGPVPLNAWLHTAPFGAGDGHWHIELLPRLAVAAGLELGAGIAVNTLAPEDAVELLRS